MPQDHWNELQHELKEEGNGLYFLALETCYWRQEITGTLLMAETAAQLSRFVILLGAKVPADVAFKNAFEGGD